jgi:hypothetical protein
MSRRRFPRALLEVLAEFGREGEREVLLGEALLDRGREPVRLQVVQHALDERVRHRGARGDADPLDALEPGGVDLAGVVDAVGRLGARLQGDLDQAHRVGGVLRADDDHQVGIRWAICLTADCRFWVA